jgi:hypothetical protein
MSPLLLPFTPRFITLTLATVAALGLAIAVVVGPHSSVIDICLAVALFLTAVGFLDLFQKSHSVLRNYPIAAHLRFIFEAIRPEMRQ